MDEEEILEYIYELIENPDLKCKSKVEYIQEILEEYFGEDDDEEDFKKMYTDALSHC